MLREKGCCRTWRRGTMYLWQDSDSPAPRRNLRIHEQDRGGWHQKQEDTCTVWEYIVTGRSREAHIVRMRRYADASLNVTVELKEVLNNLKSQGELDMERIEAVDLAADSDEYVVTVKWVRLDGEEITWEPVSTIYSQ